MTSQHDTESAILDPPLRSLIRDPQVVLHDAAIAVALDLRTVGQRNSGEEVKAVSCNDLDMNFFNMITMGKSVTCMWLDKNFFNMIMMEKRKEKLESHDSKLWSLRNSLGIFCWTCTCVSLCLDLCSYCVVCFLFYFEILPLVCL